MTNQQHPITPPPELVDQWIAEIWHEGTPVRVAASDLHIATQAARWGADMELEACCEWIGSEGLAGYTSRELRAARRPKPPSLKELALRILVENGTTLDGRIELEPDDIGTIRRALEQLDD